MANNNPLTAGNEAARARLEALLAVVSDEQLLLSLGEGWNVAAMLGHLAFWDGRVLGLIERWEAGGEVEPNPMDTEIINYALQGVCLAIAPRKAAALALNAAKAVDWRIEHLDDALWQRIQAGGMAPRMDRSHHRIEHIDQILEALGYGKPRPTAGN